MIGDRKEENNTRKDKEEKEQHRTLDSEKQ
jgi:hypothetical protein